MAYCKDCENLDPNERDGYKKYCNRMGRYVDPDASRDCEEYKEH